MPLGLWARGRLSPGLGVNHGRLVLGRRAAEGDLVQHRHRDPALQRRLQENARESDPTFGQEALELRLIVERRWDL